MGMGAARSPKLTCLAMATMKYLTQNNLSTVVGTSTGMAVIRVRSGWRQLIWGS
jgi:hypothetical protein